jgi:hypothetical protein
MKTTLTAVALTAALLQSASAITFPSLTTIYVGAGVADSGSASDVGTATLFQCSNVSGSSAQVRILILNGQGLVIGQTTDTIPHGGGRAFATHFTIHYVEDGSPLTQGASYDRGTVNIESTQSAVFCQGFRVDAGAPLPSGVPLRLVRVNPHPGTVE